MIIGSMMGIALGAALFKLTGRWFTPAAFFGQPYGFVTNQLSHAAIMAIGVVISLQIWGLLRGDVPEKLGLIAFGVALCVTYQAAQWRAGGPFWDCLEDIFFMASGWLMVVLPFNSQNGHIVLTNTTSAVSISLLVLAWLAVGAFLRSQWGPLHDAQSDL